jgi:hypothetical protein
MSVPVAPEALRDEVQRHGGAGYLVTTSGDGRPHVVSIVARWRNSEMVVGAGRRSKANVAERPLVALLWPPWESGGYSLIADAVASVDGDELVLRVGGAVLHRPVNSDQIG